MDPLTQAGVGAAVAAALSSREQVRLATIVGAIAGVVPDLDILIRSDSDPLLSLQYHRHFSHALIVAPLIGALVAVIFNIICCRNHWTIMFLQTLFNITYARFFSRM